MASDNSTIQVTDQVENLPSKPLVEAIFELHWQLKNPMPGPFVESEYQLLFARLLSDLHDRYPDYQSLEIAKAGVHFPWVVEHQFRGVGGWPIVQLGPGIIAFNETESYKWVNFESEVSRVVGTIFKIWNGHPPGLKTAVLRYIDAIELKDSESDILQVLVDKFKVNLALAELLFADHNISRIPNGFELRLSFDIESIRSVLQLRFVKGELNNKRALIWETGMSLSDVATIRGAEDVKTWLSKAHEIIHSWFFKSVEGELLTEFLKEKK